MRKYYQNKLKLLSICGIILITISSCVSKSENEKLHGDYNRLLSDYDKLLSEYGNYVRQKNEKRDDKIREIDNYRWLLNQNKLLPSITRSYVYSIA